jgi:hypothetical protein
MNVIDMVLELYRYSGKTGGEVLVTEKPQYLSTEFSIDGGVVRVGMNSFRKYYERKLGLFEKHYKERVEHGSNGFDAVTTTVEEFGKYRELSNTAIALAFQKDIVEAINDGIKEKQNIV